MTEQEQLVMLMEWRHNTRKDIDHLTRVIRQKERQIVRVTARISDFDHQAPDVAE